jgi:20S proteasome alpha/beta subunit
MTLDTIIAGKDGKKTWMLGSQDVRSMQGAEASDNTRKIEMLAQNIMFASAGTLNTSYDAFLNSKRDIEQYTQPMVKQAAYGVYTQLQKEIDNKTSRGQKRSPTQSLNVEVIVAGIDSLGPAIYAMGIDAIGNSDINRVVVPYCSTGSGSKTADPTIKKWIEHFGGPNYEIPCDVIEMPMEKGIECLTYAHLEAAEYTPTVSPTFKILYLEASPEGFKSGKIDHLPLEKMKRMLNADKEYFKQRLENPKLIERFLRPKKI